MAKVRDLKTIISLLRNPQIQLSSSICPICYNHDLQKMDACMDSPHCLNCSDKMVHVHVITFRRLLLEIPQRGLDEGKVEKAIESNNEFPNLSIQLLREISKAGLLLYNPKRLKQALITAYDKGELFKNED